MIVLHPSSRCDVCLEPYTWNTTSDTPHAIPCGHIFCKTCLRTLAPSSCPLCRKTFLPDRAKRLHVDRPPENTTTEKELDFLQRLALVSGENAPVENVAEVIEEVQTWLNEQPSDSNKPLRCAWDALSRHQALKDKYRREKAEHRETKRTLRHHDRNAAHDRRTARAVEESLLKQLQELENEHTTKITTAESEIKSLWSEIERYRHTTNPLPPPPEPLPLNRIPTFLSSTWEAASASGSQIPSQPTAYSNKGVPNQIYGHSNGDPHANGYSHPMGSMTTAPVQPSDPTRMAERANTGYSSEGEQYPHSLRLGSKRTNVFQPVPEPPLSQPPNAQYQSTSHLYPYARSQSDSDHLGSHRHRNGIIPGAAPAQRIIPPLPPWQNSAKTTAVGNMRGWGEQVEASQWEQARGPSRNATATASLHTIATAPQEPMYGNTANDVPRHFAPAAAFVNGYAAGYGTGYGTGYTYANGYAPAYGDGYYTQAQAPVQGSGQPRVEEGTGTLGLMNVPAPMQPGSVSHDRTRPSDTSLTEAPTRSHRRNNTSSMGGVIRAGDDTPQPGLYQNVTRRFGVGAVRTEANTERNSRSSWGTVNTGETRNSTSGRGSMSELGLIGLQGVAGVRGPGSTDESLLTTPVRLGHENGFMGADPIPVRDDNDESGDEDDEDEDDSPRVVNRSAVVSQQMESLPRDVPNIINGARHSQSIPYPQDGGGHNRRDRHHSHRTGRHRTNGYPDASVSGLQVQVELNTPPSAIANNTNTGSNILPAAGDISSNALALNLNPSLSSLDLNSTSGSHSPSGSNPHRSQITAPTPIVSRRNILSAWTFDNV